MNGNGLDRILYRIVNPMSATTKINETMTTMTALRILFYTDFVFYFCPFGLHVSPVLGSTHDGRVDPKGTMFAYLQQFVPPPNSSLHSLHFTEGSEAHTLRLSHAATFLSSPLGIVWFANIGLDRYNVIKAKIFPIPSSST